MSFENRECTVAQLEACASQAEGWLLGGHSSDCELRIVQKQYYSSHMQGRQEGSGGPGQTV